MKARRISFMWAVLFTGTVGGLAWWFWPESPQQKVQRLLRQYHDIPRGKFELFYIGWPESLIDAQWQRLGPEAIPALVEALNDPRGSPMRYLAARRLSEIHDSSALPGLIQALRDHDFIVRMWAIHALGDMGDPTAVPAIIPCLNDEASCVRSAAAKTLGRLGERAAVEPLSRLVDDPDWWTRVETVTALGRLGDRRAISAIRRVMAKDKTDSIREEGRKALTNLGAEPAGTELSEADEKATEK